MKIVTLTQLRGFLERLFSTRRIDGRFGVSSACN